MLLVLWSTLTLAEPEGGLRADHTIIPTEDGQLRQDLVVRGHLALEEGPFTSDVWIEAHQALSSEDIEEWTIRAQAFTWAHSALQIGYQIHRWGVLDVLSTTDILSPKDLRWGPLTPTALFRMANPSIAATLTHGQWRHQPSLHVGPACNAFSLSRTPWSLFPSEAQAAFWSDLQTYTTDALGDAFWPSVIESAERSLGSVPFAIHPKPSSAYPVDFSWRSDWRTRKRSLGLGVAWMRSRMPSLEFDSNLRQLLEGQQLPNVLTLPNQISAFENPIHLSQPHFGHFGLWYSQLLGSVGLRLEGSTQYKMPVQSSAFEWVNSQQFQGGLGLDRVFGSRLVLSGEYRLQAIKTAQPTQNLWLKAPLVQEMAFAQQALFFQQRLSYEGLVIYNWTFSELLNRMEVGWRFSGNYKATIGMLNMIGEAPEDILDRIGYKGGEIGYFAMNDTLFFRLEWIY